MNRVIKIFIVMISAFLISINTSAQENSIDLKKIDSITNTKISRPQGSLNCIAIIRCGPSITSKEPEIVLNEYPINNWNIIQSITFKDIGSLSLAKHDDKISSLYGTWGTYGVMLIEIKKKKIRKLKREFGVKLAG